MEGWLLGSYIALWVLTLLLVLLVLVLIRQIGLLYNSSGLDLARAQDGPDVGSTVATFEVAAPLGSDTHAIPSREAEMTLVLLTAPDCDLCVESISSAARAFAEVDPLEARLVVVSDTAAKREEYQQALADAGFLGVGLEASDRLKVNSRPYGVVLARDGLVLAHRGINTKEHVHGALGDAKKAAEQMGNRTMEGVGA